MRNVGRVLAHIAIILPVVLLAIAAVTVLTGSADGWLTALINGPLVRIAGERAGLRLLVQRLHAAWQSGCPVLLELDSAEVTFQNAIAGHGSAKTVRLCGGAVALHGIVAGSPQHERLLATQEVRANLFTHSAVAEKIAMADRAGRVLFAVDKGELSEAGQSLRTLGLAALQDPDSGEPAARAEQVQTSPFHLPSQRNGDLTLAHLAVTGLQLRWNRAGQTAERVVALQESGRELTGFAQQALASGGKLLIVIRHLALWALLAATVFVTILKWLASAGVCPRAMRVLISFVPAFVAYGLFFLFRQISTAAGLVVAAAALGTIFAITLRRIYYRRSDAWLKRWEPFVIDALAPVTLTLLLLLYGFELRLPSGNLPGSIVLTSVDLKALNARLESNGLTSEIEVPAANLTALKLALKPDGTGLDTAMLHRLELSSGDARMRDKAGQELARGQIQSLAIADINVGKEAGRVRPFAVKDLQLKAAIESRILARHVREFQWLPADWHEPQRLQLRVSGSLSQKEHLQFAASGEVRSRALNFEATTKGDSDSMQITSLRTLKNSPLQIGGATGTITWVGGLKTAFTMRQMSGPGFSGESGSVDAFLHAPDFAFNSRVHGANLSLTGYHASLDSSIFDVAVKERAFSTSARVSGLTVNSQKDGAQNSWLQADFPSAEAHASSSRADWKSIEGTVTVRVADGEQSIFSIDRPLRFSAIPAKGAVIVPEQNLELDQSVTTMVPRRLGLTLALTGDLQSINLQTRIPKISLADVAPLQIEIDGLQMSSQWRRGKAPELRFSSGWNQLVLPAIPWNWTLKDIAKLRLETEGMATHELFQQLDALREQAGGLRFEPGRWFRVEGHAGPAASLLLIQDRQGAGVRISPVVDTRLVRIKRGRIAESEIHADASGIRTLDGHGNLSTSADWKATGDSSTLALHVRVSDASDLLNATFLRQPGRLRFSLDKELSFARFIPEARPFLSQAGIDLSNFEIGATLLQLEGQADFAGSQWTGLAARVETAPGPLFRFTPGTPHANPLEVAVGSGSATRGLGITLAAKDGTARVTAEVPVLAVRSGDGAERANIDADVTATLSDSTEPSPLISKIRSTSANVWAGIEGARRVFGANSGEKAPLAWKLSLSNDVAQGSAFTLNHDRLKLHLRAEPSFVSLGRSMRFDFSSSIAADLSLQEDQLILDALTRTRYDAQFEGVGRYRADVSLPLLIAFGDALQPVNAPQGPLWDSRRYLQFWDGYRPVNAAGASKDSLRWTEVALGPVRIEEVSIVPPLHATVELWKEVVQLDLPAKGSFLYGESAGTLQSQLRWAGDEAVLDSFIGWTLQGAQTDALHLATRLGYRPFVQDRIGLSLAASARGVTLNRRVLQTALADPGRFNQFDKMALDLDVGSVPGSVGRLQFESDFDVKRMNALMRQIATDIQLTFPPESITWDNARLKLRLKDGALQNDAPLVALTGVQGARNNLAQFSSSLRLFAGRDRTTPFQDVVHTLTLFNERFR